MNRIFALVAVAQSMHANVGDFSDLSMQVPLEEAARMYQ